MWPTSHPNTTRWKMEAARIREDTRQLCGVIKSTTGTPCESSAGAGTDHMGYGPCMRHGGTSADNGLSAKREKANNVLKSLGLPLQVHPIQALLGLVHEAAGNVAFLREKVSNLGFDLFSEGEGSRGEVSFEAKLTWKAYNEERDRLAKMAKLCLDVGLSERMVKLTELQTAAIVAMTRSIVRGLELSPEQEESAMRIASREMLRLSNTMDPNAYTMQDALNGGKEVKIVNG